MHSQSLSELVNKVFGDEDIKKQFMSDPDSVMSKFSLTEEERRVVLSTHSKMALAHPGSSQTVMAFDPLAMWF